MPKYKNKIKLSIFLFVLLIAACSTETTYKVLSFVFDGVPDPDYDNTTNRLDSVVQIDSTGILDIAENIPTINIHQPYKTKSCNSCHDNSMATEKQPGLCYSCHESFEDNYAVVHGPALSECTSCHNPHQSKFDKLVKRENEELCFYCHSSEQLAYNDVHSLIDNSNCTECHNPHGEENKFFLKEGTCYKCHDDFNDTYKHLHGPVDSGFCNSCHDNHSSEKEYKLLLTGQEMCLKCHNKSSVFKNENHEGIEDFDCTECHNPHGGDNRYILN
ncbi:MAG: hypothetical protein L3J35_01040 [Bacteroidales bacterium]|nr:hypothetical protein [Bacteroidales bacterium]